MSIRHRLAAHRELFNRYREVFSHFWKERKNLGSGLFNEQEAAFLPAALSIQEKPVSSTARLTARVLITLIVVILLWAILGKMDIIVNATGKIIPSDYTKTIASVEIASVRALHVQEGQSVKAGDVLIELDSSNTDTEHDKAVSNVIEATLQIARSQALITAIDNLKAPKLPNITGLTQEHWQQAQNQLDSQYHELRSKLARIDDEIARYATALPLASQQASNYKALAQNGDVATDAWLEKEQRRIELKGQLNDAKNQRAALIAQARKDAWDALTEGRKAISADEQDVKRSAAHSQLLKLVSPVDGTVQQLAVHTIGGVVPAAQPLMLIVPKEDHVVIEAFIDNKDVGFVREGQRAAVKIDAFDYSKYDTVPAQVVHVSRDAIQDEKKALTYSIKVILDKAMMTIDGKAVPLSPGMSVSVEIKTGERRIIEYFLSPFIQHQHEALRER